MVSLKKLKSRRYLAETIANYLAPLANATDYAESLLHRLNETARNINFHVKSDKTEFIECRLLFKWQASEISRLVNIPR